MRPKPLIKTLTLGILLPLNNFLQGAIPTDQEIAHCKKVFEEYQQLEQLHLDTVKTHFDGYSNQKPLQIEKDRATHNKEKEAETNTPEELPPRRRGLGYLE
jgi:hypothetical protein